MASGKSAFYAAKSLKEEFYGEDYVAAASLWLRLYTDTLTTGGVGTEVSAAGYAPVELVCDDTVWLFTAPDKMANIDQIPVGVAAEDWGELTSWGLWDAETAGNLHWVGEIDPAIEILEGAVMVIPAGMIALFEQNES